MKKIIFVTRMVLTLSLIYGIYLETGKWTALFSFLVAITCELTSYNIKRLCDKL